MQDQTGISDVLEVLLSPSAAATDDLVILDGAYADVKEGKAS
jgi:hypothetical protein